MKKALIFSLLIAFPVFIQGQGFPQWGNLRPGKYAVGFTSIKLNDHSRSYGDHPCNCRPLVAYIWYPAVLGNTKNQMTYNDYVELWNSDYVKGIDPYRYQNEFPRHRALLTSSYPQDQKESAASKILSTPLAAHKDAAPVSQKFPVVYSAAGGAGAISQGIRLEFLASHGYVVISFPQLNSSPAFFETGEFSEEAILQMAQDLNFIHNTVKTLPYANVDKTAVIGMSSFVGYASYILSGKIDAIADIESFYPEFLKSQPYFDKRNVTIPIFSAYSAEVNQHTFLLDSAVMAERFKIVVANSLHRDFYHMEKVGNPERSAQQEVYEWVSLALLDFLNYTLNESNTAKADLISAKNYKNDRVKVEIMPPTAVVPPEHKFLEWARYGKIGTAKEAQQFAHEKKFRGKLFTEDNFSTTILSVVNTSSSEYLWDCIYVLLNEYPNARIGENFLNRLGYAFQQQGKPEKALTSFAFWVQHYPNSANAHESYAEILESSGKHQEAIHETKEALRLIDSDASLTNQFKDAIKGSANERLKRLVK